jgi:ribosomal protein L11 methyltransferase
MRARFGHVEVEEVTPGWSEAWRAFHQPVRIGSLWIGPPWELPATGSVPIVIDPGQAFGTGSHPTTRLCLELLLEEKPGSLLDVGCGSGVLALAAARLGFDPIVAVDVAPEAVAAAAVNAAANGLALDVRLADALNDRLPVTHLAVGNLELELVERFGRLTRAARLIVSGFLAADRPELPGWTLLSRRELGGWAAERRTRTSADDRSGRR